jgi:hypothetical protein
MSGLLAGKVWLSNLDRKLKPLAATLADIANDDGTSIYPSVEYVAWRLSSSERSVRAALSKLRRLGVLERIVKGGYGPGSMTEYHLLEAKLPPRPAWSPRTKGANPAPLLFEKGAKNDRRRVQKTTAKGANPESIHIDPLVETSEKQPLGETSAASPPGDPRHRAFAEFATETFRTNHSGQLPAWSGKDWKALSILLQRNPNPSLDEMRRRWTDFLSSTDRYIRSQGDSLAFFCSNFDRFIDGPLFVAAIGGKLNADERDHRNFAAAGFH